jgi:hypothetical protein
MIQIASFSPTCTMCILPVWYTHRIVLYHGRSSTPPTVTKGGAQTNNQMERRHKKNCVNLRHRKKRIKILERKALLVSCKQSFAQGWWIWNERQAAYMYVCMYVYMFSRHSIQFSFFNVITMMMTFFISAWRWWWILMLFSAKSQEYFTLFYYMFFFCHLQCSKPAYDKDVLCMRW